MRSYGEARLRSAGATAGTIKQKTTLGRVLFDNDASGRDFQTDPESRSQKLQLQCWYYTTMTIFCQEVLQLSLAKPLIIYTFESCILIHFNPLKTIWPRPIFDNFIFTKRKEVESKIEDMLKKIGSNFFGRYQTSRL